MFYPMIWGIPQSFFPGAISRHLRGAVAMGDFRTQWFNGYVFLSSFDCTTGKLSSFSSHDFSSVEHMEATKIDMSPRGNSQAAWWPWWWSLPVKQGWPWSNLKRIPMSPLVYPGTGDLWDAVPVPEIFGIWRKSRTVWNFFKNSDFEAKHGEMWHFDASALLGQTSEFVISKLWNISNRSEKLGDSTSKASELHGHATTDVLSKRVILHQKPAMPFSHWLVDL